MVNIIAHDRAKFENEYMYLQPHQVVYYILEVARQATSMSLKQSCQPQLRSAVHSPLSSIQL